MTETPAPPVKRRSTWLLVAIGAAGALGLVVLVVGRLFVLMPFSVPSGAMLPTIPVGAHCFARGYERTATRGAVMVFRYPEHREQLFAKRVIGVEGDVIEVKDKKVSINGWPIPRCAVGTWSYSDESMTHTAELSLEFLGDATYLVAQDNASTFSEAFGPFKVAAGQFFVVGDNRDNSHDSRMWYGGQGGGVPNGDALGRVHTFDELKLPSGAESLAPALSACLAKRPPQTSPPASH